MADYRKADNNDYNLTKINDHSMVSSQCQEEKEAIGFFLHSLWSVRHAAAILSSSTDRDVDLLHHA